MSAVLGHDLGMTRLKRIAGSLALIVVLSGCGTPSSDEVVADLASAWADQDVDAALDLTHASRIDDDQRARLADAMANCEIEENSEVDVPGEVSAQARAWGFVVTCSGTRSLVAGNIYNTSDEEQWTIGENYLPGGAEADFVPSSLPAKLRSLPKAGV